jgi:hypothetical protein
MSTAIVLLFVASFAFTCGFAVGFQTGKKAHGWDEPSNDSQ